MKKYNISKELRSVSKLAPPVSIAKWAKYANIGMRALKFPNDPDVRVGRTYVNGYRGDPVEVFVITPNGIPETNAPCLVYFHGGGFMLEAAPYHYRLAVEYAKRTLCRVVFVRYRLAPDYPFPTPVEDCYAVLKSIVTRSQSSSLPKVDPDMIAVGGDSAGGCIAAAVSLMARDRMGFKPRFQLLVYPVLDLRMKTDSMAEYTDTPMWNADLNRVMWQAYLGRTDELSLPLEYAAPMEAADLSDLPPTYIETAEFDCLHDEALIFADRLKATGVPVTTNPTVGTVHGYDIVDCVESQIAVATRVWFMQERFYI